MSWIRKTVSVPQQVDLVVCDGCGFEKDDPDSTWTKLSVASGERLFHFCEKCRPSLLSIVRAGFGATASAALKDSGS